MSQNTGNKLIPRKTFFLYAGDSAEKWLAHKISQHEYESFFLNEHRYLQHILGHFSNSILLINTTQPVRNLNYIDLIKNIKANPMTASTSVGAISSLHMESHYKSAPVDFHVSLVNDSGNLMCDHTLPHIIKVFDNHKARGRRQFIRTKCNNEYFATFSIKMDGKIINGFINDISSAGMQVSFPEAQTWDKNTYFQDIQLRLFGTNCNISGSVMGSHDGDPKKWIILFDCSNSKNEIVKIQNFVSFMLRKEMEEKVKRLYPN